MIELEDDDDPQVIFETLNARGVPLLPSDLIRNFVFLRATQQNGPFEAKRPEIAKQSVLRLNTYFQDATTWDEAEIAKRGEKLLEHAKRIWPRPQPTP